MRSNKFIFEREIEKIESKKERLFGHIVEIRKVFARTLHSPTEERMQNGKKKERAKRTRQEKKQK